MASNGMMGKGKNYMPAGAAGKPGATRRKAIQMANNAPVKRMAKGGKVHDDAAEDKKMIDAAFKKRGMKKGGKC